MSWSLIAKRYPIPATLGAAGHLYFEILNDNNQRVHQIHGFATDYITGQPKTVGSTNDFIETYIYGSNGAGGDYSNNSHESKLLYSGSQANIENAMKDIFAARDFINAQNFNYDSLAGDDNDSNGFGNYKFNSNSTFNTLLNVFKENLPITNADAEEALLLGDAFLLPNHPNPGAELDMFHDVDWSRNANDPSNVGSVVQGSAKADLFYFPDVGKNEIYGNGGNDTLVSGAANDNNIKIMKNIIFSFAFCLVAFYSTCLLACNPLPQHEIDRQINEYEKKADLVFKGKITSLTSVSTSTLEPINNINKGNLSFRNKENIISKLTFQVSEIIKGDYKKSDIILYWIGGTNSSPSLNINEFLNVYGEEVIIGLGLSSNIKEDKNSYWNGIRNLSNFTNKNHPFYKELNTDFSYWVIQPPCVAPYIKNQNNINPVKYKIY